MPMRGSLKASLQQLHHQPQLLLLPSLPQPCVLGAEQTGRGHFPGHIAQLLLKRCERFFAVFTVAFYYSSGLLKTGYFLFGDNEHIARRYPAIGLWVIRQQHEYFIVGFLVGAVVLRVLLGRQLIKFLFCRQKTQPENSVDGFYRKIEFQNIHIFTNLTGYKSSDRDAHLLVEQPLATSLGVESWRSALLVRPCKFTNKMPMHKDSAATPGRQPFLRERSLPDSAISSKLTVYNIHARRF
jgi:hypothetical protein